MLSHLCFSTAGEQSAEVLCCPLHSYSLEDVEVVSCEHLDRGREEVVDHVHVHVSIVPLVVYSFELDLLAWQSGEDVVSDVVRKLDLVKHELRRLSDVQVVVKHMSLAFRHYCIHHFEMMNQQCHLLVCDSQVAHDFIHEELELQSSAVVEPFLAITIKQVNHDVVLELHLCSLHIGHSPDFLLLLFLSNLNFDFHSNYYIQTETRSRLNTQSI